MPRLPGLGVGADPFLKRPPSHPARGWVSSLGAHPRAPPAFSRGEGVYVRIPGVLVVPSAGLQAGRISEFQEGSFC